MQCHNQSIHVHIRQHSHRPLLTLVMDITTGVVVGGYEFLGPVGQGGFANIFLVRSQKYNCNFVAKVARVKKENIERTWASFDSEIKALMRLDHPNIIKLYDHFQFGDNFVLILEHCPNGSLADYISKFGPMKGPVLAQTIRCVCSALKYAWSQGVQHRDIKPANILFDEGGRAKLVDFGIATMVENETRQQRIKEFSCSPLCAAPEILRRLAYDPVKSDIWALGVTILWLAKGSPPWTVDRKDEMLNQIKFGQVVLPSTMNPAIARIGKRMVVVNPDERAMPSEEELDGLTGVPPMQPVVGMRRGSTLNVSNNMFRMGSSTNLSPVMAQLTSDQRRGSGGSLCLSNFRKASMLVGGQQGVSPVMPGQPLLAPVGSQQNIRPVMAIQRRPVPIGPKRTLTGRPVALPDLANAIQEET